MVSGMYGLFSVQRCQIDNQNAMSMISYFVESFFPAPHMCKRNNAKYRQFKSHFYNRFFRYEIACLQWINKIPSGVRIQNERGYLFRQSRQISKQSWHASVIWYHVVRQMTSYRFVCEKVRFKLVPFCQQFFVHTVRTKVGTEFVYSMFFISPKWSVNPSFGVSKCIWRMLWNTVHGLCIKYKVIIHHYYATTSECT